MGVQNSFCVYAMSAKTSFIGHSFYYHQTTPSWKDGAWCHDTHPQTKGSGRRYISRKYRSGDELVTVSNLNYFGVPYRFLAASIATRAVSKCIRSIPISIPCPILKKLTFLMKADILQTKTASALLQMKKRLRSTAIY